MIQMMKMVQEEAKEDEERRAREREKKSQNPQKVIKCWYTVSNKCDTHMCIQHTLKNLL